MARLQCDRLPLGGFTLAFVVGLLCGCGSRDVDQEDRWMAFDRYMDPATGATVVKLTDDEAFDEVIYQTHPMWVGAMEYLVFHREASGLRLPHALHVPTGTIKPLFRDPVDALALSPVDGHLYAVAERRLMVLDVREVFEGLGDIDSLGALPGHVEQVVGGLSVAAGGSAVYVGASLRADSTWAIFRYTPEGSRWTELARTPFKVGHVQASPDETDLLMFCHETGGDAPQRTWLLDAHRASYEPLYVETFDEWVTHEAWWGGERVIFTIWPYDDAHRALPHGILSIDRASRDTTIHEQYPAWHTHGSPDGRWILGDDFDRNLWLIDQADGTRALWTAGHTSANLETHPHASFTPDSKAAVFNSSRGGHSDIYMVLVPSED